MRPLEPAADVVVLGGGYAAVWSHRAVRRALGGDVRVTVVAPHEDHTFHGATSEVLSGELRADLQRTPLREAFAGAVLVRGAATSVDVDTREVTVGTADGEVRLPYDALVVATGARERTGEVSGLLEHGYGLRSADALARLLTDADARVAGSAPGSAGARVVVVGAGLSGVEASSALARRYRGAAEVVLVASPAGLASSFSGVRGLRDAVASELGRDGVQIVTGRVASADRSGVLLSSGERVEAETVVTTAGFEAAVVPGLEAYADPETGRLVVSREQLVAERVWAAGDVALSLRSEADPAPADALWATVEGTRAGRNVVRALRGREGLPLSFGGLGSSTAFGVGRSASELLGRRVTGPLAWTLRFLIFLWFVPSRRHALRFLRELVRGRARGLSPAS